MYYGLVCFGLFQDIVLLLGLTGTTWGGRGGREANDIACKFKGAKIGSNAKAGYDSICRVGFHI
jgi:hypothetical protein